MITPSREFLEVFKNTNGALSVTESICIMNIAAQAPNGIYMELGTHKGKSAMAAMCGLTRSPISFFLLEPEFKDSVFLNEAKEPIELVQRMMGDYVTVLYTPEYSTDFIGKITGYSYVFVDSGSHQDGLPMQEVKMLEDGMVQGGIICFHDWDSQFQEVKEASDYLVGTGKYDYININWEEIVSYVNENNLEEGNTSWHHTELKNPCFVGAVKRK